MSIKEASDHADIVERGEQSNSKITAALKAAPFIDAFHQDEAVKVMEHFSGERQWDELEEKKLVRKIDRKLMPLLFLTYGLQYYDKTMLSQAAIFGMRTDLDLETGNRFSISSSIFYMGFVAGAMPAILIAQRFPLERVTAGIIFTWGVCLLCTIACQTYQGLYAQRFFLGFLESGISPMFMLIVAGFYKKNEQAMRIGTWFSANGFVSIVTPLVNWGLGHIKGGSLSPWKYMYLVAGCLTILWSLVLLFLMPPDPIRAKGFTKRERYIAVCRLRVNNAGIRNIHFKADQVIEVLFDVRFWIAFAMGLLIMIANGPVSSFFPIVIGGFGFTPFQSLLLVMPAGFVAGVEGLLVSHLAYKFNGWRTWLILLSLLPTILAAALLWKLPRDCKGGLLAGVYLLGGFAAPYGILMGLQIANTAGYTKKSVTSSGLFLGYCLGNITGPLVFKASESPFYSTGFTVVVGSTAAAGVLSMCYRYVCIRENHRRDRAGTAEAYEDAYNDDLTDLKNPHFRYCL